jgi:hypothetical protein
MSITYTTTINSMYCVQSPQPDYVVNVLFTVSGTDGTHTASIDGNVQLAVEASDPNFVPYADLTEEIVMGWINAQTDNQANYYANIDGQLESIINPPVSPQNTPLPWSSVTK